ncbi:MAG: N-acetylmuramoyl-L-alanine amidase CwlD [Firmicutes bacterium]|nr:N-acetylmuramoyl-L-alanine amidase CwlD [Bacillota bacterium]
MPLKGKVIVLDPGHGGYDPGVMKNGIEEKEIVLKIAFKLRDYLQAAGARVVMTRESDRDFLDVPAAGPKKQQDMTNRMQIVNAAGPDLFISLHVNAIGSPIWHGAQVFYKTDCTASKEYAEKIQQELRRVLGNTERQIKPGNYYVLNHADSAAVLVECGFLSHPREAQELCEPAYQSKVAWAVYGGILRSFLPEEAAVE